MFFVSNSFVFLNTFYFIPFLDNGWFEFLLDWGGCVGGIEFFLDLGVCVGGIGVHINVNLL